MGQHVIQFEDFNTFKGFHYSDEDLEIGSTIISKIDSLTASSKNYKKHYVTIWNVYKAVADKLGLYYPKNYGYAYPTEREVFKKHAYLVTAPVHRVTKCDYRYSIQLMFEDSFFSPMGLKYALNPENYNALVKHAYHYFTPEKHHIECISDAFTIVKKLS